MSKQSKVTGSHQSTKGNTKLTNNGYKAGKGQVEPTGAGYARGGNTNPITQTPMGNRTIKSTPAPETKLVGKNSAAYQIEIMPTAAEPVPMHKRLAGGC
jgi:hypothetical protein